MTDTATRNTELRQILTRRRLEMRSEMQSRIRDGRADRPQEGRDILEHSEADIQGDIEFALLQMRSEMLIRIDEALARLEAGEYGSCHACGDEISEARLHALPFAVRCQACEEKREQGRMSAAQRAQQQGGLPLFALGSTPVDPYAVLR